MDPEILYSPSGREQMRIEIERELCSRSMAQFFRRSWHVVEPNDLIWNWHIDAIAELLTAALFGQVRNLVFCVPPGSTKSLTVSSMFPAFAWIKRPNLRIIGSTYGQVLSNKNAEHHLRLVQSAWYQARWPHIQINPRKAATHEFHNTLLGWRMATSVTGRATGMHGDISLSDDLAKAQDADGRNVIDPKAIHKANDFWFRTMQTRRTDALRHIRINIGQRLHYEDTPGRCIDTGDYVALVLPSEYNPKRKCRIWLDPKTDRLVPTAPAGAPEPDHAGHVVFWEDPRTEPGELLNPSRFPAEVLAEDRTALGPQGYAAQHDQDPAPVEGNILKRHFFRNRWRQRPSGGIPYIFVDCSFKDKKTSDYVSAGYWLHKAPDFYRLDREYARMDVLETVQAVLRLIERNGRAMGVYIEDKANGPAVMQILRTMIPGICEFQPMGSKESRAQSIVPIGEAGNIIYPDPRVVTWDVEDDIAEHLKFPLTLNDDRTDELTMAILTMHKPGVSDLINAIGKWKGRRA